MLYDRTYNQILSQFKLQLFSITLLHKIADLTSMKVISFGAAALVCDDKRYTV